MSWARLGGAWVSTAEHWASELRILPRYSSANMPEQSGGVNVDAPKELVLDYRTCEVENTLKNRNFYS